MESPPKRVTRARAAAASTNNDIKIATAGSRAKVVRTATTMKRKTREEEQAEADDLSQPSEVVAEIKKPMRGRPKKLDTTTTTTQPNRVTRALKNDDEHSETVLKPGRGRPKKSVVMEDSEPIKTSRGRVTKNEEAPSGEPVTRGTRSVRATANTTNTTTQKTVKFAEPDKENVVPVMAKGRAKKVETTAKPKPIRKPSVSTRATRGNVKLQADESVEKPMPLSPKKSTQISSGREASDDELATDRHTPMRPLLRSPIKAPGSAMNTAKKLDFSSSTATQRLLPTDSAHTLTMGSPARRLPMSPFKDAAKLSTSATSQPALFQSPIRRPASPVRLAGSTTTLQTLLLQSPAKRAHIMSPARNTATITGSTPNPFLSTPNRAATMKISRFATPRTVNRLGQMGPPSTSRLQRGAAASTVVSAGISFSGRLSSIVPREVDPLCVTADAPHVAPEEDVLATTVEGEETSVEPEPAVASLLLPENSDLVKSEQPSIPVQQETFQLRRDESPFYDTEDESEDELASSSIIYSPTPKASAAHDKDTVATLPQTPIKVQGPLSLDQEPRVEFTPLVQQLSRWMASSPVKVAHEITEDAQAHTSFFDDEMSIREEMETMMQNSAPISAQDINFDPVELDELDVALAQEAEDMSMLDSTVMEDAPQVEAGSVDLVDDDNQLAKMVHSQENDDPTPSEASQDYADENAPLMVPNLHVTPRQNFQTPTRVLTERVIHTVSKVPTKAPAEHTPMRASPMKRSKSVSRLPVARPTQAFDSDSASIPFPASNGLSQVVVTALHTPVSVLATPTKSEALWSSLGTPARTPRRDLNAGLLKGAIVFVDVHTSEGADASGLFTELLTQMGARCVRTWAWNGHGDDGSKIGITHVIFKDGGVRTLEKTREAGGVVQCVGVGWVLE